MGFVQLKEYYSVIRKEDLDEILSEGHDSALRDTESKINERVKSYLRHRYDVDKIIYDVPVFSLSPTYYVNQLVRYEETAYSATTSYSTGDRISYEYTTNTITYNYIYESLVDSNLGNTPNTSTTQWQQITENGAYYVCRKQSQGNAVTDAFSYSTNIYTSNHENILGWDRSATIYFKKFENYIRIYLSTTDRTADNDWVGEIDYKPITLEIPSHREIKPGNNTTTIFGGTLFQTSYIDDNTEWDVSTTNYFEKKDTRNNMIVDCYLNMVIFKLHSLISPRNIPDYISELYEESLQDLTNIQKGNIMIDAPFYEQKPQRGGRITVRNPSTYKHKL